VLALQACVMTTTMDLPEVLVKQAKQNALHQRLTEQLGHAPVSCASGALAMDQDGLPLFRAQASQGCRQPVFAESLALEHSTLEQEDLQRVGLAH
jgi:hypothetical protein